MSLVETVLRIVLHYLQQSHCPGRRRPSVHEVAERSCAPATMLRAVRTRGVMFALFICHRRCVHCSSLLTGELVSIESLGSSVICTPRDLVLLTNCTMLPWRLSGVKTVLPLEDNSDLLWFVDIQWRVTVVAPEHSPSYSIHHAS